MQIATLLKASHKHFYEDSKFSLFTLLYSSRCSYQIRRLYNHEYSIITNFIDVWCSGDFAFDPCVPIFQQCSDQGRIQERITSAHI